MANQEVEGLGLRSQDRLPMGPPCGASREGANGAGMGLGGLALLRRSRWRQGRTRFAGWARRYLEHPSQPFPNDGGPGPHQWMDGGY